MGVRPTSFSQRCLISFVFVIVPPRAQGAMALTSSVPMGSPRHAKSPDNKAKGDKTKKRSREKETTPTKKAAAGTSATEHA